MCESHRNPQYADGVSRRQLVKSTVSSLVAIPALIIANNYSFAQAPRHYRPIQYSTYRAFHNTKKKVRNSIGIVIREEINRRTKHAFDANDERKLNQGISIAAMRMLDPQYWEQALDRASVEFHNFGFPARNYDGFRRAVGTQMRGLLRNGFPKLHVTAWDSAQYTGQATYEEAVRITWNNHRNAYDVHGEFRIEMSKTGLRERSAEETAGTIVHEMLHQMGHGHGNGYYDNNFMTVFGDIVAFGRYVRRQPGLSLHGGRPMYLPG